jgi:hypothetical protein
MRSDTELLDWLEEHAIPTSVDGKPTALAIGFAYHLNFSLREAINAWIDNEQGV